MKTNNTVNNKQTFIVGVTGGIGCGKTTVTNLFAAKGIDIVDADLVAREVVVPGSQGLSELVSQFGDNILDEKKALDRAALRTLIFADNNAKVVVNKILHPLIRENMLNQLINTKSQYCILSAPLLFENKLQTLVNRTLVIDIPETLQLERTMSRDGGNIETIKSIMRAQISREKRLALADDIIDNSKTINFLKPQVNVLHLKYMTLASK
jgi:dephospho-CoA kinase